MRIIKMNPDMDVREQLASDMNNSIFLAGPCPRKDYSDDWRNEAFRILDELGFDGNVITPTNDRFQELRDNYGNDALVQQTRWEYEAMKKASAIVFWIDRHIDRGFPAFTTNIEFGDWYDRGGTYFGFPDGADKNEYLKVRLDMVGKPYYTELKDVLKAAVDALNRPGQRFFTSDTHFSQERTRQLLTALQGGGS